MCRQTDVKKSGFCGLKWTRFALPRYRLKSLQNPVKFPSKQSPLVWSIGTGGRVWSAALARSGLASLGSRKSEMQEIEAKILDNSWTAKSEAKKPKEFK
jgi:hypothetical protein